MAKNRSTQNTITTNTGRNQSERSTNCDKYKNNTQNRTSGSGKSQTEKNVDSYNKY